MAELKAILESAITKCRLCDERMSEPCLLPCLHSFCRDCLVRHAKGGMKGGRRMSSGLHMCGSPPHLCSPKSSPSMGGVPGTPPGSPRNRAPKTDWNMPCPACQHKAKPTDVKQKLQPDFFLDALLWLDEFHSDNPKSCAYCAYAKRETTPATSLCLQCQDMMCQECADAHLRTKVTRGHALASLEEVKEGKYDQIIRANHSVPCDCNEHNISQYCTKCDVLICDSCMCSTHDQHSCTDLDRALQNYVAKAMSLLGGLQSKIPVMRGHVKCITTYESSLKSSAAKVRQSVEDHATRLHESIEKSRLDCLSTINTTTTMELENTDAKKQELEQMLDSCEDVTYYVQQLLQYGTPAEVLSCKAYVSEQMNHLNELQLPQIGEKITMSYTPGKVSTNDAAKMIGKVEVTSTNDDEHEQQETPQPTSRPQRSVVILPMASPCPPTPCPSACPLQRPPCPATPCPPPTTCPSPCPLKRLPCPATPCPAACPLQRLPCPPTPCPATPYPAACPLKRLPCPPTPCPATPCPAACPLKRLPCPPTPCPATPCPAACPLERLPCPPTPCPATPCPAACPLKRLPCPPTPCPSACLSPCPPTPCPLVCPSPCPQSPCPPCPYSGEVKLLYEFKCGSEHDTKNIWPTGIAFDNNGNFVILDRDNSSIKIFDHAGKFMTQFGSKIVDGEKQLSAPYDLVMLDNGNLAITDYDYECVRIFTPQGQHVRDIGRGFLKYPRGITLDKEGLLVVADCNRHRVTFHDPDTGKLVRTIEGHTADGCNIFTDPYYVAVNHQNYCVVTDWASPNIKIFDTAGKCCTKYGTYGTHCEQILQPYGICIDHNGFMFAADNHNHRVHMLAPDGKFIDFLITKRHGLWHPMAIAITPHGHLAVTEALGKVKVFQYCN